MTQKNKIKKNRDQFQIPNKNRIKLIKRDSRQYLRNNKPIKIKTFLQSPMNSDELEYQQKLINRGTEWWIKVDRRFFRDISAEEIDSIIQKATSEEILSTKYPARQLQTYYEEVLTLNNPFLASACLLKVLFRNQIKQQNRQNYELITYAFKEYKHDRQKVRGTINQNVHIFSFRYPKHEYVNYEGMQLQKIDIDIIDIQDSQQQIKKLLRYDVKNMQSQSQVQRELALWNEELDKLTIENGQNLQRMLGKMKIIKKKEKKQRKNMI